MNAKQIALHWREWGKAVRAMRAVGAIDKSSAAANEARKRIYASLRRPCSSIKAMTNGQFTEFLMICWAWNNAEELNLQMREEHQPAIINRYLCNLINTYIQDIAPGESDKTDQYYNAIYKQQNQEDPDPDTGSWEQWHKVMLAMCYRYDQVCRKASGTTKQYSRRYWPSQHADNLRALNLDRASNEDPF